ncbi:MAG: alpha-galactosidase [Bacteroidales bacterium]|nr:alpha-galactosidase [Bacteroidales bacterium]
MKQTCTASLLAASLILFSCRPVPPAVKPPMMGWSSWNAFEIGISDSLIMQQADLLVSTGLAKAGYTNVNIDDGFFGFRDSTTGCMTPNPLRFPGGIEKVTAHIHGLGLKAGIYSDAGANTCGSYGNGDIFGRGAGLYGHTDQDAQLYFNDWNFDFIKIDYCGAQRLKLEPKERYTRIREVIDSVSDHAVALNICRWHFPGIWAAEIADSWRISGDLLPEWKSVRSVVEKNLYLSAYAGNGHYNDMDMLVVGYSKKPCAISWTKYDELCLEEESAHFGMWCIMSSPLALGFDLAAMPEETFELITNPELIAINQDPLGLQAYVIQHEGESYALVKDVIKLGGKQRALALYNPSDEPVDFDLPIEKLELEGKVRLRDLILREDLPDAEASIRMSVPAHSAKILSVKGSKRLETKHLEAEWSFIPAYNDIGPEGGKYIEVDGASCGAGVLNLGGSPENRMEWRNIIRRKKCHHTASIRYKALRDCDAYLEVNGKRIPLKLKASDDFISTKAQIVLAKGTNTIALGNDEARLPVTFDSVDLL